MTGAIPTELGALTSLKVLSLSNNLLTGAIPAALGNLSLLTQLWLDSNQLTGAIPGELGGLANLAFLSLYNNQLTGAIPAALGNLSLLRATRFAGNTDTDGNPSLTGCVPHGLRYLMTADQLAPGVPAQDFIELDANDDGDTDDDDDTPGLNLPFCMLSALTFSDVSLTPAFASGTVDYTASVASAVAATTVTATLSDNGDTLSIMEGTASYANGASVPLDAESSEIAIEITPADTRLLKQTYTVTVTRVACTLNTGDLWCGVVTVGTSSDGVGFVAAETETDTDVGALTDNNGDQTITIGSDSYTIPSLLVLSGARAGTLAITLDKSFPTDDVNTLEFYTDIGTKTFKVSEATAYPTGYGYFWADSDLTWSDGGPNVTLRLRATPDAPTNFTAKVGDTQVALGWDAAASDSGVTGHEFRYKTDGDYPLTWTAIADSGPGETNESSFTVTGLTNEVAHTFELHAVNAAGAGDAAEAGPVTPTPGICDRTQKIQDAILAEIADVDDCAAVTDANLASITSLGSFGFGTFNQGITSLQKGDFAGLTSLTILRLGLNGLTALPEGIFAGLVELNELNLGTNQLESLPEGVFDGLVKLEYIILSENSLTGVPAGAFDGLPVLAEITLIGNELSSLPEDLFSGLTALSVLFLGGNDLESLPDGVFSGLTALERLGLNGNDLTMLPVTVFSGLTSLTELSLNDNDLESLPDGVFSGLTALEEVKLDDNELSSLPGTVFSGLTALNKLYLQDNNLITLPDGLFTGVTLGTLHLGRNSTNPMELTVTVEKVGTDQVRAKVLAGAPFAVNIPVTLANGTLTGGLTELSVAAGAVYSDPVTMTRTALTTAAVTVDVDLTTQPTLPADNSGYTFVKATVNLPATILPDATNAAPAFTSSATFNPAENQTAVGTVEAEDSDTTDDITGYALNGGADQALFAINSGVLTFQAAPNYEDPQDADTDNAYVVVVRATSGTGARVKTADQTITGDGDGRGRAAGQTGQADGGGGLGLVHKPGRELDRAGAERRPGDHRLPSAVPKPGEHDR